MRQPKPPRRPTPATTNPVTTDASPGTGDASAFASGGSIPAEEASGLYRLLVESVQDYAIFALDTAGHVRTWNEGAHKAKGYTAKEIVGRHFSIFYSEDDRKAGKPEQLLLAAERQGRVEDEGWRFRKDGSRFWANVVITALHDTQGTLVGFAKVTRDLSERRRAEEALRESEERFRLIVQSVRDYGIFMLDPEGHIASWNAGAERIKGYTASEVIGRHFSIFYPREDIEAGKPQWELQVAKAEGSFEDEGWRLRKDGSRFWANVIITRLLDDHGILIGYGKVTRDLTERKAAETRAIEDARRLAEAESANRAKAQFLAAMSHELRTPLNAIGGYAQLMESGVGGTPSEQQTEYLGRIRGAQQHLLGIINDLLNYSRIEAGQLSYEMKRVLLTEVVGRVVTLVQPQALAKQITVVQEPGDRPVEAWADRSKLDQVVLNIISNAVKFTPPEGRVIVRCRMHDGAPGIEVRDSGPGIPPEARESVFEPFVQLGRNLTSNQEGTGLGLAISRDLTRAMGGDISVDDAPEGGACFTLRLCPPPAKGTSGND